METKEYTIYTFEELSDRAKETARDWFREGVFTESHDWECIYEDAATVAECLGIDIRQRRVDLMGGGHRYEPSIYFSGFWSQGDGACYEGSYSYRKGMMAALAGHIGKETDENKELYRIARDLMAVQRKHFYQINASMKHRGHYYHSGCMSVDVERDSATYQDLLEGAEDEVIQLMRDFADWIYKQLETEQEYQSSDECVDENIKANEYTFDEDGNRED